MLNFAATLVRQPSAALITLRLIENYLLFALYSSIEWHSNIKSHCCAYSLSDRMVIEGTPFADAMQTEDEMEALVDNEIYAFTSLLCENKSHEERCKNCDDIVRYDKYGWVTK